MYLEKVFYNIPRKVEYKSVKNWGTNNKLTTSIDSLYSNSKNTLEEVTDSRDLKVVDGLIMMYSIMWELYNKVNKLKLGYRKLETEKFADYEFADDLILIIIGAKQKRWS